MVRKILLVCAAALALPVAATAAKPAQQHPVVFVSDRANGNVQLYSVNTDGTGYRRLTYDSLVRKREPTWSPDGSKIAFAGLDDAGNWDIYTVDADGGNLHRLTTDPERDDSPQWANDRLVVYQHGPFSCPCHTDLVSTDGSFRFEVPTGAMNTLTPTVSPSGEKIAFASDYGHPNLWAIYTSSFDGHGLKQVTYPTAGMDLQPEFSSNGSDISFVRDNGTQDNDLYVVQANGKQLTQLTSTPSRAEFWSSWNGDSIVFSALGDTGWHLYSVPAAGGPETSLSPAPQAPYTDSFDHGQVDQSFWYILQDPDAAIGVRNGRLVTSIAGTAVPGGQWNQTQAAIGSPCHVPGDFDMQVDYTLLNWPAHGGFFATLHAVFADGAVSRISAPWDPPYDQSYNAWSSSDGFEFAGVNTLDMSGQLRLVRTGSTISAYERAAATDAWNLFFTGQDNSGEGVPQLEFSTQANTFGHQDGSVAFDNFRLSSGSLTCPSWWQDWAPNVH
jgi:hypothetical protein